ncbi:MAG: acetaldehyde dehydrogenase (acetylating) [Deltaproteobacteria bacterium]|nr:acetaldehyde dehydrogenase (acetylating) [Deltaproteobacteria bacterium]
MEQNGTRPRTRAAIIGPGNIGTDLLLKALRSDLIEPVWSVGVVAESEGLAIARKHGLRTTADGVDALLPHLADERIRIAFDATSAKVHAENSRKLEAHGVLVIDLTPAAIGPPCVPPVNLGSLAGTRPTNVNLISCGGQATIPMVAAVSRVQPVGYAEIVATVASRSIGPGTRDNIDEFTRTTARGVEVVGGARRGKAIIVINPADPPIMMRDTIHCLVDDAPDEEAITRSVHAMVAEVQRYVPGYRLKNGPVFDGRRVSIWIEVTGLGDYLPKYAGNLDIMTAAALRTAEMFAEEMAAAGGAA